MMQLGKRQDGNAVRLPVNDLLTHGVVLGRTGSGKSGLTVALLEEVTKSGAHALVLDPKGDLTNLALSLSSEDEFANWADFPDEARLRHGEGLASSGLGFRDVEEWREHVDVRLYAPGKNTGGGRRVNLFPDAQFPGAMSRVSRARASQLVTAVLGCMGGISDPYDPAAVFLTEAVLSEWTRGRGLPVVEWPGVLANPAQHVRNFGGMSLDEFFPKNQRTKLARKLIGFHHQADRWLAGERLDLRTLCASPKPQIAVFSLRHLPEEDRQFFAGLLLSKVVDFMFETEASEQLKLLVVLDEARGYLPPHPSNPPTKGPICTILAQGRAQGVGMIVGTQNPMDLDYKALSNVGTWFIGRLRERDCARDLATELGDRHVSVSDVADMPQRNFLLLNKRGGHTQFETRWTLNYLFGPLSGEQLFKLEPGRLDYPAPIREPVAVTTVTPQSTPEPVLRVVPGKSQAPSAPIRHPAQKAPEEPVHISRAEYVLGGCVLFLLALSGFMSIVYMAWLVGSG